MNATNSAPGPDRASALVRDLQRLHGTDGGRRVTTNRWMIPLGAALFAIFLAAGAFIAYRIF